jgi:hypothetical protein
MGACHRLFTVHVFAGLQRGNRNRHVQVVVQADVHCLNVVSLQEFSKISIGMRDAVELGDPTGLPLVSVGYGNDLGAAYLLVLLDVTLADLPDADDAQKGKAVVLVALVGCYSTL